MDERSSFCCLNPACIDLGKRVYGNLTVTSRYGLGQIRRLLRCRTGKTRFSERKGTPDFDTRLSTEKVTAVLAHMVEGIGTRKTARLTGVHTDTVARYIRLAGAGAGVAPAVPGVSGEPDEPA